MDNEGSDTDDTDALEEYDHLDDYETNINKFNTNDFEKDKSYDDPNIKLQVKKLNDLEELRRKFVQLKREEIIAKIHLRKSYKN
jgi:hypothetical protein